MDLKNLKGKYICICNFDLNSWHDYAGRVIVEKGDELVVEFIKEQAVLEVGDAQLEMTFDSFKKNCTLKRVPEQ